MSRTTLLGLIQQPMDLEEKIAQVYEALRTPVFQYLAASFGNRQEAEDITQETFLRLYVLWTNGKINHEHGIRSWVFRVAHNLAIDYFRSAKFVREIDAEVNAVLELVPDARLTPEQALLDKEKFQSVQNGLALLSVQERQCLHLRADGFRYREISEIMNINTSTVAEFLRRAIRKMTRQRDA